MTSIKILAKPLRQILWRSYSVNFDRAVFDAFSGDKRNVFHSKIDDIDFLVMNFKAKKNALSKIFVSEMSNALDSLENDTKSRLTIVYSTIPNVFCAGADLRERAEYADDQVPAVIGGLRSLFHRIYRLDMPTLAAIDGVAVGGGLELALACDLRFAGTLPLCQLGLIESHWALLPGAGGSQRLPRLIGSAKAKELMFGAKRLTPRQAESYGVVNEAIDPIDVPRQWHDRPGLYGALQYAGELATKGPIALRQAKRAINEGLDAGSLDKGLDIEGECYKVLIPTKDRKEGMAAFAAKRQPIYKGE